MSQDASAGRLYLEVVADASGLRRDIRDRVAAATQGIRAKVQLELDATQLRAQAKEAARLATVTGKVEFDRAQIRREAALKVAQATRELRAQARVQVDVDTAGARAQINAAARDKTVRLRADADTAGAEAQVDGLRARQSRKPIDIKVRVEKSALSEVGATLTKLSRLPAIASGIALAVGAVSNLAGALFSMGAAASQAVGVLAALPNAAGVAVQGLAALVLGFSGIGAAVKAMSKVQTSAGRAATSSAATQAAAAEQIRAAHERVAQAQEAAIERVKAARQNLAQVQQSTAEQTAAAEQHLVDVQAAGARQIEDAQRRVRSAHEATTLALKELSDATEAALQHSKDLALELSGGALDEEAAKIAIERARARLTQITGPGSTASSLDKREADNQYRQALQRLAEIENKNQQLATEKAKQDKTGVLGTDQVVAAQRRVRDAVEGEALARRDLKETTVAVARSVEEAQIALVKAQNDRVAQITAAQVAIRKSQRDGAREVATAQRALTQALAAGARGAAASTAAYSALNAALAHLSPAGRAFAQFITATLMPRFYALRNAVQGALLPPLKTAIIRGLPLLDTLQTGLVGTGRRIGALALDLANLVRTKAFRADLKTIMASNNRALTDFGRAGIAVVDILRKVAVVAGPVLLEPFAKWVRKMLEAADASNKLSKSRITAFLERAKYTAKTLGGILGDVARAIFNLGRLSRPAGATLLGSLAASAEAFRRATADPRNAERIQRFFANTVPVMQHFGTLLTRIVGLFVRFGEITGGGSLEGLFWVLDRILDVLTLITKIPGGGPALAAIFTLSGVGLGIGLVAKGLGNIVGNFAKLSKYSGVGKLLDKLSFRRGKKSGVSDLADEVGGLTGAIDKELPRDKKKTDAVGDLGGASVDTGKKAKGLGGELETVGKKAEEGAKKTGRFSRILGGIGKGLGKAFGKVAGLAGLLLAIPGIDKIAAFAKGFAARVGSALSSAFSKLRLPQLGGALSKGGGLLGNLFGKFSLPSIGGIVAKIGVWFKGLFGGIGRAIAKFFTGGAIAKLVGGAAKGGFGGPLGIIGGILSAILGDLVGGSVGGAISGAGTGAGIGALVGSIVPGLGTALGAIVGGIIGAITGGGWWGKIADFFTHTLPSWIGEQARKLPGAVGNLLAGAGGLAASIGSWIWGQLGSLGKSVGNALSSAFHAGFDFLTRTLPRMIGAALAKLPGLIIDGIFALPGLIFRSVTALPNLFGWLGTQATSIITKINLWFAEVPGKIGGALLTAARAAPQVFVWLSTQANQIGLAVVARLREAWNTIAAGAAAGLADARAKVAAKLGEIRRAFTEAKAAVVARLREAWASILSVASSQLSSVRNVVASRLSAIGAAFTAAKNAVTSRISEAMSTVAATFRTGLNTVHSIASSILGKVSAAFGTAKAAIGKLWAGVSDIVAVPVRWIGTNVYTKGIKAVWDKVADLVHVGHLPPFLGFAAGGVLPGYTPGRDVMSMPMAAFSGGEAVMRPEFTRAVGPAAIGAWNRLARTGGVAGVRKAMGGAGFAAGGVVQRFADGGIVGKIGDLIAGFTQSAKQGFLDGVKSAASLVLKPIVAAFRGVAGNSPWGKGVAGVPPLMANGFLDWLGHTIQPKIGGSGSGVVAAARKYLGVGDDRGRDNDNYFTRTWGWPAGTAWCALFASTAIRDAKAGKHYPGYPTASVFTFASKMKHVGLDQGRAGDLATYYGNSFGHVNIITGPRQAGGYPTIGGNQGPTVNSYVRGGQSYILRPAFARGGIIPGVAKRLFGVEMAHADDPADRRSPLTRLFASLSAPVADSVMRSLGQANLSPADVMVRDRGGALPPGTHLIRNDTGGTEWILTPEAVRLLGGGHAVERLNTAAGLYRPSREATPVPARQGAAGRQVRQVTQNIYPQPRQSEMEIAMIANRRLGALIAND